MFIEYTGKGRSARDKELLLSKARAHAARWSSQRSRQRRSAPSTRPGITRTNTEDEELIRSSSQSDHDLLIPQSAISDPIAPGQRWINLPESFFTPQDYRQFHRDISSTVASSLQSYPVHIDSNALRSIEYFPKLWSRWASDVIPNQTERQAATEKAVASIVQRCLTDELQMNAFISYVLQRAPAVKVSKTFLLKMAGKALSELRSRIEGGNASLEEVVWPIIFMAHFELFGSKSVGAGRAHLKAVVELGGMEYLDEVTKVYIRRMDRGWWSDYPSIFPASNSPRPRWEILAPDIPDEDFAGSGFFDHNDVLGSDLTSVMPSVIDCVRAGVSCKDRVLLGSENEALQNKVIRKCQSLMDALRERLPAEPVKMACIYPAMIWLQYMTWAMRDLATKVISTVNAYREVTSHAHPNLLRCVEQSSRAPEMLLWAAAVGIATSSDAAARTQYAHRALVLAESLDIADLRNSWKGYVWFEESAIIDYGLICAAFDAAVQQDPSLATKHWHTTRRALLTGLGQ